MFRTFLLLAAALPLAACGGKGEGTSISIDAKSDSEGNSVASVDQNGQVAIKAEGFQGSFKLPKISVTAENLDLEGVKLYPGSSVSGLHVDAREQAGESDKGQVKLAFTSPAPLATVQAWFRDDLAKRGARVEASGTGFHGATKEGEPFTLDLEAAGADRAKGKMTVGK